MCHLVQINKFVKLANVVAGRQRSLEPHNTQGSLICSVAVPLAESVVLGNLDMRCCVKKGVLSLQHDAMLCKERGTQFTTLLSLTCYSNMSRTVNVGGNIPSMKKSLPYLSHFFMNNTPFPIVQFFRSVCRVTADFISAAFSLADLSAHGELRRPK